MSRDRRMKKGGYAPRSHGYQFPSRPHDSLGADSPNWRERDPAPDTRQPRIQANTVPPPSVHEWCADFLQSGWKEVVAKKGDGNVKEIIEEELKQESPSLNIESWIQKRLAT